ncbi:neo-calmodulin-like [Rhopilema esculentum]|uniref:neo-calmodulin-like n=1 Tax=Rhopilema esculentum TaxID=499914 RepID=UPI0031E20643|eukprot:gene1342-15742_t
MAMSFGKNLHSKVDPSKQEADQSSAFRQKTASGYSRGNSKADSNKEQKSSDSTLTGQPLDLKIPRQHLLASEEKEESSEYFSMIGEIGASSKINKQMTEVKLDDLGEIRQIFDVFDQDGNGVITANELRSILGSLGQSTTEAEVMDMVNSIDADGNGIIEFPEFLAMIHGKLPTAKSASEFGRIFKVFDVDNSSEINADNLKRMFRIFGQDFDEYDISDMLAEADFDGDGKVGFEDFIKLMKK